MMTKKLLATLVLTFALVISFSCVGQPAGFENDYQSLDATDSLKKRLVFSSDVFGNLDLFFSDVDGANLLQVTSTSELDTQPDWSPDGHQIVFVRRRTPEDDADLYILEVDTLLVKQITDYSADETTPTWSPDGQFIAFTSDRDGDSDIYILDLSEYKTTQLLDTPNHETAPDWSPDGKELLYVSDGNLYTVKFEYYQRTTCEGQQIEITSPAEWVWSGRWSPDGEKIVYAANMNSNTELFIMNRDGSGVTQMTSGGRNVTPNWSPDGQYIVYSGGSPTSEIYMLNVNCITSSEPCATDIISQITYSGVSANGSQNPSWEP